MRYEPFFYNFLFLQTAKNSKTVVFLHYRAPFLTVFLVLRCGFAVAVVTILLVALRVKLNR